nr:type ISP restriction/modification enzyme [Pleurocapsa sp. FMAR1]
MREIVVLDGSNNLVYLDESGFEEYVYRPYGWSKRGQKTYGERNGKRGTRTSLIAGKRGKELLFHNHYCKGDSRCKGERPFTPTKLDIFHYTYAVLHNPAYREKYELNLKREFPRIPFYDNFRQWTAWGKQLMDLHINYETIEPYTLKRIDIPTADKNAKFPKVKLQADKDKGVITLDTDTSLHNIPPEAWEYKLGNRSALEWILDQYKEKKPKDQTIAEKFNTYRFADYKEQVTDLLQRVCTVSVETMKIIEAMEKY